MYQPSIDFAKSRFCVFFQIENALNDLWPTFFKSKIVKSTTDEYPNMRVHASWWEIQKKSSQTVECKQTSLMIFTYLYP